MGVIALYDADMQKYKQTIFNLELMKLSTYYKNKRQIVNNISNFNPERYSQIIYRKDYNDGDFPAGLTSDNISYGGLAFSNNIYIPLEMDQELALPDTSIYQNYESYFSTTKERLQNFSTLMRCFHTRLSLDGKNIWNKACEHWRNSRSSCIILLHDYDINQIPYSFDACYEIMDFLKNSVHKNYHIGFKFPIYPKNDYELLNWLSLPLSRPFCTVEYKQLLSAHSLEYMVKNKLNLPNKFIYNLNNFLYPVEDFYQKTLPIVYKQILFCRRYEKKILLKYDKNLPNLTDGQRDLLQLLSRFANFDKMSKFDKRQNNLYNYAKQRPDCCVHNTQLNKEKARNAFYEVAQYNPEVFDDFYRKGLVDVRGDEIVYV